MRVFHHHWCVLFLSVVVSLTKTGAKGKTLKAKLIEVLRENIDEYERVYVFSFENMRTARFRDVRMDWKESK